MKKEKKWKLPSKLREKLKYFSVFVTERLDMETLEPVERVTIDPAKDFPIGPDLRRELRDSPGVLAFYGTLREQALAKKKHCRYKWLKLHEKLYEQLREEHPKLSETGLKVKINRDKGVLHWIEQYMLWSRRHGMLDMLYDAWAERHQTLRTLETSQRGERELS